ncbi:MAG: Holliday junction resolvase-like protein [Thermoplasmata archaeon]
MNIDHLIVDLQASGLVAECPVCDEEFPLSDALLFDGMRKFPESAEDKRLLLLQALKQRREELTKKKISADVGAERKAIAVGFGKTIEKFIPAHKDLKLEFSDCRPLYDPIDLVVFDGMVRGKVEFISFVEIKTGKARLNKHQRMVRDAVQDGKVGLKVMR